MESNDNNQDHSQMFVTSNIDAYVWQDRYDAVSAQYWAMTPDGFPVAFTRSGMLRNWLTDPRAIRVRADLTGGDVTWTYVEPDHGKAYLLLLVEMPSSVPSQVYRDVTKFDLDNPEDSVMLYLASQQGRLMLAAVKFIQEEWPRAGVVLPVDASPIGKFLDRYAVKQWKRRHGR